MKLRHQMETPWEESLYLARDIYAKVEADSEPFTHLENLRKALEQSRKLVTVLEELVQETADTIASKL